ncbi:YihY/virulence factor BrkB family protein [Mariniphaga sp.]|uniref:YihY/virulence factor BrkB family protein n=1 Tax=Mariniphaga sp. TaxID=1954475 RepID=UPI003567B22B
MNNKSLVGKITDWYKITRKSLAHFMTNRPVEMAGTTAYFAIFSMVPIIIIIVAVFGIVTGDKAISEKLFEELSLLVGQENSVVLEKAINNYELSENSLIGTIIGVGFFLVSATTLFSSMQSSINFFWRVKTRSNLKMNVLSLLRSRILSFGVILSLGFVLLVSLIIDAIIAIIKEFLATQISPDFIIIAQVANFVVSLAIVSFVIALIYKYLPDVKVKWSASWFGAVFTAVLFATGKLGIGFFIGNSNLGQVYGAASSIVVILIWIYFASLIFYFGVELTYQFSKYHDHDNSPASFAIPFEINKLNAVQED